LKFDHVHLRVSDLDASTQFYATVLAPLGIVKTRDHGELVEFGDLALSADGPPSANVHRLPGVEPGGGGAVP
jgi:catechol 2,3-dioxygenase-like lactoylglutathione lyase family enzyme